MSLNVNRRKLAVKVFCLLSLVLGGLVIAAPYVLAQVDTSQQQQVVSDFATFIINILTGPVSKILGALLLIGGVTNVDVPGRLTNSRLPLVISK